MYKIAFLFLTTASMSLRHEEYWNDFLRGHAAKYSVYTHTRDATNRQKFLHAREIKREVMPCEDTWLMECALLKEALKDTKNIFFIFVSESTIPLQQFNVVYDYLLACGGKSIISYKAIENLNPCMYKNNRWIILNRKHAQMMVNDLHNKELVAQLPCGAEFYPSNFLGKHNLLKQVVNELTTFNYGECLQANDLYTNVGFEYAFAVLRAAVQAGCLFASAIDQYYDLTRLDAYLPYRWYRFYSVTLHEKLVENRTYYKKLLSLR